MLWHQPMGSWSGQPFGNDGAGDWSWELDDRADWEFVRETLTTVVDEGDNIDASDAADAIAAAEVVAHGLGRPTQNDSYTESVESFVQRVGPPPEGLADLALTALAAAASERSELFELWDEDDPEEWIEANARIADALQATP